MQSERKTMTQPPDWWAAFQRAADRQGLTLAQWMGEVCSQAIPSRERNKLSDRPPAHRPPKDRK